MITQHFRLNELASQYAAALHDHITTRGGVYFMIDTGGQFVRVYITGGVRGGRDLIDCHVPEALRDNDPHREAVGMAFMTGCASRGGMTDAGTEIRTCMADDTGETVAGNGGGENA